MAAPPFDVERVVEAPAIGDAGESVELGELEQDGVLPLELVLELLEHAVGGVALRLDAIGIGVGANARDELDTVGDLDQVVIGAVGEGAALVVRVLLARQDDHRDGVERGSPAVAPEQGEAVDARHDQILEDDRRAELHGVVHGALRVAAVVEGDVALGLEHLAEGGRDDRLVVDQQHHRWPRHGAKQTNSRPGRQGVSSRGFQAKEGA